MRTATRSIKWILLSASSACLIVWGLNVRYWFRHTLADGTSISAAKGTITKSWFSGSTAAIRKNARTHRRNNPKPDVWHVITPTAGYDYTNRIALGLTLPIVKTSKLEKELDYYVIGIPLWLPFLLFALPTAYLWHRERRRPTPGHCPTCNYDMTGNQSKKCPECGTPTPRSEPAAPAPARETQPR